MKRGPRGKKNEKREREYMQIRDQTSGERRRCKRNRCVTGVMREENDKSLYVNSREGRATRKSQGEPMYEQAPYDDNENQYPFIGPKKLCWVSSPHNDTKTNVEEPKHEHVMSFVSLCNRMLGKLRDRVEDEERGYKHAASDGGSIGKEKPSVAADGRSGRPGHLVVYPDGPRTCSSTTPQTTPRDRNQPGQTTSHQKSASNSS